MEHMSGYDEPLDQSLPTGCDEQSNDGVPDIHFSFVPDAYQQDTSDANSLEATDDMGNQMCALEDLSHNPMAADVPRTPSISVVETADWSRLDFEGFGRICAGQEIVLPKRLHDAASAPERPSLHTITEQSGMFAAIGAVASMRRRYPDEPLIEKPLDVSAFGDNVPALAIANMLNASLLAQGEHDITPDGSTLASFALGREAIGACGDAEYYFAGQLIDVPWIKQLASVVFEKDGLPVFYRKTYGAESVVTLTDVDVGGAVYGKGYIMRVLAECDNQMRSNDSNTWAIDRRSLVYPTSEIIEVTPMRPSAFGLSPEQRATYFPSEEPTSRQLTVDDFVRRSQETIANRRNA
jgi:hypothetical protein